jgi:hypothetical protein
VLIGLLGCDRLEHFQEKWEPVFRPEMRPRKKPERIQFPLKLNTLQSQYGGEDTAFSGRA